MEILRDESLLSELAADAMGREPAPPPDEDEGSEETVKVGAMVVAMYLPIFKMGAVI